MFVFIIVIAAIAIVIGGFLVFSTYQVNHLRTMPLAEMLAYTTKKCKNAKITIGVLQDGTAQYTLYGENGTELPKHAYIYEIGSITKTFTTSLLLKAAGEGRLSLDDGIDKYLNLPPQDYYPTLRRLITHTAGYKSYHLDARMISQFFRGKNSFTGITTEELIKRAGNTKLVDKDYGFRYSNFGISLVGAALSTIYGNGFISLMNAFVSDDLGLENTNIIQSASDAGRHWNWAADDAYTPAGALTSTIGDMLKYAEMHMDGTPEYLALTHEKLSGLNKNSAVNAKLNIRMDSIGAAWIKDEEHNIIWHNGGTRDQNSYLGFDPEKKLAVVVLSNLAYSFRIPATVIGAKLLTDLQKL